MRFPGDQVIAPPDQGRRYLSGEQEYGVTQTSLDDKPYDFAPGGHAEAGRSGRARRGGTGYAPATPGVPRPRQGHARQAVNGRAPRPANKYPAAAQRRPGGRPAGAEGLPGRPRRGPARGYPPLPGDPGPRYPQPEFSAWNEPAGPASPTPDDLPCPAPTWAGAVEAATPASLGLRGVAAPAERADELAEFSADDLAVWAARPADEQAVAPDEPSHRAVGTATIERASEPAQPDVGSLPDARSLPDGRSLPDVGSLHDSRSRRGSGVSETAASAAGVTRAAATKARKNARRRGRTRRRVVLAGVCLPAIAVVAAMAYVRHPHGPATASRPSSHARPAALSASQPTPALGRWQHIGTRAADPSPLTLSQLFPARFTAGSTGYTRTTQLGSARCARAVFGTTLQAAVLKYKCSQVMRASYLARGQKLMGTIGVLNLSNSAGAKSVGEVTGSSQFIAQLTAASGPTHRLANGTGLEEAEVKGHYLILTWVEFTTLRAPTTAHERAQLKAFSADLISRTANVSLTSRMVTGEPQLP